MRRARCLWCDDRAANMPAGEDFTVSAIAIEFAAPAAPGLKRPSAALPAVGGTFASNQKL